MPAFHIFSTITVIYIYIYNSHIYTTATPSPDSEDRSGGPIVTPERPAPVLLPLLFYRIQKNSE